MSDYKTYYTGSYVGGNSLSRWAQDHTDRTGEDPLVGNAIFDHEDNQPKILLVDGAGHLSGPIVYALELAARCEAELGIPPKDLFFRVDLFALLKRALDETPPAPSPLDLLEQAGLTMGQARIGEDR